MNETIPFIAEADFQSQVLEANTLVIVNFWADWCGKCKMIDPLLDEVAVETGDKLKIVKVDLDNEPKLAERFPLFHVPALLFFKKGEICDEIAGSVPKKLLLEKIQSHTEP
jgi:thioredoxin 1